MARAGVVLWLLHPAQPGPCPALKGNPLHVRFKTRHVASATTDCPSQEKSGCPKSQHQFQKRGSRVFQRGKAGAPGALCSKTWHWGKQRLGALLPLPAVPGCGVSSKVPPARPTSVQQPYRGPQRQLGEASPWGRYGPCTTARPEGGPRLCRAGFKHLKTQ